MVEVSISMGDRFLIVFVDNWLYRLRNKAICRARIGFFKHTRGAGIILPFIGVSYVRRLKND